MFSAVPTPSKNYFVPLDEDDTLPPEFKKLKEMAKKMADDGKVNEYLGSETHSVMFTFYKEKKYKRLTVEPCSPEPTTEALFKAVATSIEDSIAVAYAKGRNAANFLSELRRTVSGHPVVVDADFEGTEYAVFYSVSFE